MTTYQLIMWCWRFGKKNHIDYREIYLAYQEYKHAEVFGKELKDE